MKLILPIPKPDKDSKVSQQEGKNGKREGREGEGRGNLHAIQNSKQVINLNMKH